MRLRAWPRKRGTPKSQEVRDQNAWFKGANALAKRVAPALQAEAIRATAGTGLYPRDYILRGMSVGYIDIIRPDGKIISSKRRGVFPVGFQGFIIRLSAAQTMGSLYNPIILPLPQIDTAGFWDMAQDDRITIPAGVEIMNLEAGFRWDNTNTRRCRLTIWDAATEIRYAYSSHDLVGRSGSTVSTGPILVTPGQQFQAEIHANSGGPIAPDASYFSGTILQAT